MPPRSVTTPPPRPPRRATITDDIAPDELTLEKAEELLEAAADDGRVLGEDPATGHDIVAKAGRYGPYVTEVLPEDDEAPAKSRARPQVKPRTASLFKDMDLATVDLDTRCGCCRCRGWSAPTPRTARRSPRRTAATGRT